MNTYSIRALQSGKAKINFTLSFTWGTDPIHTIRKNYSTQIIHILEKQVQSKSEISLLVQGALISLISALISSLFTILIKTLIDHLQKADERRKRFELFYNDFKFLLRNIIDQDEDNKKFYIPLHADIVFNTEDLSIMIETISSKIKKQDRRINFNHNLHLLYTKISQFRLIRESGDTNVAPLIADIKTAANIIQSLL